MIEAVPKAALMPPDKSKFSWAFWARNLTPHLLLHGSAEDNAEVKTLQLSPAMFLLPIGGCCCMVQQYTGVYMSVHDFICSNFQITVLPPSPC